MVERTGTSSLFDACIRGTVARVHFANPDSAWVVLTLDLDSGGSATVVGALAPVYEGEGLEVEGSWESDRRYGRQFRARRASTTRPHDLQAVERYLASGAVPGIGKEYARRLVKRFGADTLRIFDEEPERLLSISGIGPKRLAAIKATWGDRAAEREARIFLQGHGLGPALTDRILRAWGGEAIAQVEKDPYRLATEFHGVGFRTADAVAVSLGWQADSLPRVRAGVIHVLRERSERGHCYVPYDRLVESSRALLELDEDAAVRVAIAGLIAGRELVQEILETGEAPTAAAADGEDLPRAIFLARLHGAEQRVAQRLALIDGCPAAVRLQNAPGDAVALRTDPVAWVERDLGRRLGDDQRRALQRTLSEKVLLVTGGPGTGKTTLIEAVVRCFAALRGEVALAAPTGRAAKRLEQATGRPAATIHRLLEFSFSQGFGRCRERPLDAGLVVVDEASMVDLPLMDALLAAIPPPCRLLLVGDADQLPPVGPGAVLRDLLASGALATVRLEEIYRQARRSLIVHNAHRVNRGDLPIEGDRDTAVSDGTEGPAEEGGLHDYYFISERDPLRARDIALHLVTRRIPQRFGLDPRRDVQVLVPMHRGECGVGQLNAALQEALNPTGPELPVGDVFFRVGDRVMQLRNDYDREVFNGDVGRVVEVEPKAARLGVRFSGRRVDYDRNNLRNLSLAYAISIHKSQGSEYPAVVVLLLPEHRIMLQRNLLYTALTRAQRLAVLISTRATVRQAVRNAAPAARFTRLARRLSNASGGARGRAGSGLDPNGGERRS